MSHSLMTVDVPGRTPPAGHYPYALVHDGLVYVSGQLPVGKDGSIDAAASFDAQAELVLDHLEDALAAAGTGLSGLLKVDVYIADIANWSRFDLIYARRLGQHRPARAVVPVPELHYGFAVEVAAIACGVSA